MTSRLMSLQSFSREFSETLLSLLRAPKSLEFCESWRAISVVCSLRGMGVAWSSLGFLRRVANSISPCGVCSDLHSTAEDVALSSCLQGCLPSLLEEKVGRKTEVELKVLLPVGRANGGAVRQQPRGDEQADRADDEVDRAEVEKV